MKGASRLLNLGCGDRFHPAWINADHLPAAPEVLPVDASRPLPFPDAAFEAVYASHVLEHLSPAGGRRLLSEIRRVLAPGGTVRLVVPDVERSARAYLALLDEAAASGRPPDAARHRWLLAELFDQMVRERTGGEQAALRAAASPELERFIAARVGGGTPPAPPSPARASTTPGTLARAVRRRLAGAAVRLVGGPALSEAFETAAFRATGEVHRAAYDRHALARALAEAGFEGARPVAAEESAIPGFAGYELDAEGGRPRKPDSLYMEATRPGGAR